MNLTQCDKQYKKSNTIACNVKQKKSKVNQSNTATCVHYTSNCNETQQTGGANMKKQLIIVIVTSKPLTRKPFSK